MPKKKGDKPNEAYPLKLTERQRGSLLHCTRLKKSIKQKVEQAGEGMQAVLFTRKELDALDDELGQAALFAPVPDKKRLIAVLRKVTELLEAFEDAALVAFPQAASRRPTQASDLIVQFRITLLEIKPAIWRRIQVPDCTLDVLHSHIQAAFGWWNYHMHQFEIDGMYYGLPEPAGMGFEMEAEDETRAWLSDLLPKAKRKVRWVYEYDFGDGWRHEILFEGYPARQEGRQYPMCVGGARACPPEDCGGPWGYADYLDAISDPGNERHDELLEWRGAFDPEAFDAARATREMRKKR